MRRFSLVLLVPLSVAMMACRGNTDASKVDAALDNDLSLAGRSYSPLDTLSPAERAAVERRAAAAAVPARQTVIYRTAPAAAAPAEPVYETKKNTGRDAAIGAGAGAIIGAATSKNKVKGGIIGAAAGGLLGAVIGNNVDKKKVPKK